MTNNNYETRKHSTWVDRYGKTTGVGSAHDKRVANVINNQRLEDREKIKKLISTIYDISNMCGYRVESRIVFRNIETGEIFK